MADGNSRMADGRGRHGNHRRGSEHYRWNSERMYSSDGYVLVRVGVEHPLADPNGYAYEHLLVWVSAGLPPPGPGELIHHKDEDKSNNRLDNFELLTRGEHNRHHNAERGRDGNGRFLPT
jgi:HNH endonuclease